MKKINALVVELVATLINKGMYILYKTTNIITGKYYIGVSNNRDRYYKGSGTALLASIRKHGRKNFIKEVLETFETSEEAFAREAEVVNEDFVKDCNTYNVKVGGKGGIGQKKSEEHRQKIRAARAMQTNLKGGRKLITPKDELKRLVEELGTRGAAEYLGISWTALRGRLYR